MHPERAIGAFLASFAVLVPLPYHWRTRNVGGLSLIIWLFLCDFIFAVDAIVWIDNASIIIPVWCDITTKLLVGANMGISAACICIAIQLEHLASNRGLKTNTELRRDRILAVFLCWILPVFYMIIHYVFQGHRFDIFGGYGCRPYTYNTLSSVLVICGLPMAASLITGVYSFLSLYHFYRHRIIFTKRLSDADSAPSATVYLRLLVVLFVQMTVGLLVNGAGLILSAENMVPWISWDNTHLDFWRIRQFPEILLPPEAKAQLEGFFWVIPAVSVLFAGLFSFKGEVLKEYRGTMAWVQRVILRMPEDKLQSQRTSRQMIVRRTHRGDQPYTFDGLDVPFKTPFEGRDAASTWYPVLEPSNPSDSARFDVLSRPPPSYRSLYV